MTQAAGAGGRIGAPIAAQMISLMAAGWIITLAVTVGIVLLLPQPPRPSYPLAEVAEALSGGRLVSHGGQALVRVRQADPPAAGLQRMSSSIFRNALAAALHRPLEQVRFERYPVSDPFRRVLLQTLQASPPRPVSPAGVFLPPMYGPPILQPPAPKRPAHASPRARAPVQAPPNATVTAGSAGAPAVSLDGLPSLADNFDVAVKDASGSWTVVKPAPPPFPDPWQLRIVLWFVACFALLTPIGYLFARRLAAPIGQFARAAERLGRDPKVQAVEISGPVTNDEREVPNALECLYATVIVMTYSIINEKLRHGAPDLLLQPNVGIFRALGFLQASAILRAAEHVKDEVKSKLSQLLDS